MKSLYSAALAALLVFAAAPAFAQTTVSAGDTENSSGVTGSMASSNGGGFAFTTANTQNLVGETANAGVSFGPSITTNAATSTVSAGQDNVVAGTFGAGSHSVSSTMSSATGTEFGTATFHFP